jgi:hypothetical protein
MAAPFVIRRARAEDAMRAGPSLESGGLIEKRPQWGDSLT